MLDGTSFGALDNRSRWRWLLALLVLSLTVFRIGYLGWFCPLDLAQDEAHYWDWSRNLDWSYYSKGPLIAWLIRLSVELFGSLSLSLTGSEMLAVRLPAVVCGSLFLIALFVITRQTWRSDRLAFSVVLIASTVPVFSAMSLLITIDSPYVCCWSWALMAGHRALFRNERWAWILAGLLLGLGILAKQSMTLWLFSFCLFLRFSPGYRHILSSSGFWIMVGVAGVCSLPIFAWNATHEWVTFRHVAGQAGLTRDRPVDPSRFFGRGLLDFVGGQFALLLGWWFLAWLGAIIHYRPGRERDPNIQYLWWMSVPTILVFGASSFRNPGQVNWPVAAYVSGSVLMIVWLLNACRSSCTWFRRLARTNTVLACAMGLLVTILAHDMGIVRPWLNEWARKLKPHDPYAVRLLDPSCRFRGWHCLGREIDEVRRNVRELDGRDPVLAGIYWNLPGEIGFYCEGHPRTYSLGPYICERVNQYDLWHPNPVADAHLFAGQTFIVVNGHEATLKGYFEHVVLAKTVVYQEQGIPISSWTIWICRNYAGIDRTHFEFRIGY